MQPPHNPTHYTDATTLTPMPGTCPFCRKPGARLHQRAYPTGALRLECDTCGTTTMVWHHHINHTT